MEIFLIAAVDKNLAIGKDGKIPWHIKEDLKYFQKNTLNTAMIMGRSTFESIGKPLPNRQNIVMTRSPANREGVIEVLDSASAIKEAKKASSKISIIGGESIYKEFLPLASKLLITDRVAEIILLLPAEPKVVRLLLLSIISVGQILLGILCGDFQL